MIKKNECELCSCNDVRVLVIHHINRNHDDNRKENLQILCSNCHMIVHYNIREELKKNKTILICNEPEVSNLDNDMFEVMFPRQLTHEAVANLIILLGYRRNNNIILYKDEVLGFVCHKDDLEDAIRISK